MVETGVSLYPGQLSSRRESRGVYAETSLTVVESRRKVKPG